MVLLGLFESFVWQIYLMGTYLYLLFSRILTAFIISGVLTKKWVWVLPFPICVLLGPSWTLGQWKICFGDLLIHTHNFYFDRFGHYMIFKFFLLTDRLTDGLTNRPTDRLTDKPTDIADYRASIAAKKLLGRLQKSEKGPNCGQIKNKRCGCTFTQSIMQFKSFSKSAF